MIAISAVTLKQELDIMQHKYMDGEVGIQANFRYL